MRDFGLPGRGSRPMTRCALVAGALLLSLAVRLSPALGDEGPTLAFLGQREGRVEVYSWRVGDAEARRLTDIGAPWGAYLQWSPDGRRLSLLLNTEGFDLSLWAVDAAAGEATRLTPVEVDVHLDQPCWDDNGELLYLCRGESWPPGAPERRGPDIRRIYRIPADGGEATPITPPGRYADLAPAPGGGVLFAQALDDGTSRLVQMDREGRQVRTWEPQPGEWLGAPAAHGEALAADRLVGWDSSVVIWTQTRQTFALGDRLMWFPVWSPDGQRLLVESFADGRREILLLEPYAATARPWRKPAEDANEWDPQWSPDGALVAYTSDRGGKWSIYVADREGRQVAALPGDFERAYGAVFQPRGGER